MEAPWRIEMLGGLRAVGHDREITRFQTQKTAALLAHLAYHPRTTHSRETLIELLWPDVTVESGRNSLSVALSSLRHQFEPPGTLAGSVVIATRAVVHLNPQAFSTDTAEFENAIISAANEATIAEQFRLLRRAVELYHGELMPGHFEEWIIRERERLSELFLQAVMRLTATAEAEGDLDGAINLARRAVAADPLREESHTDLIRLYAAVGQPTAAVRQYRELERILREEVGLTPTPAATALVKSIGAELLKAQPRPTTESKPTPKPQPLPAGVAIFVLLAASPEGATDAVRAAAEAARSRSEGVRLPRSELEVIVFARSANAIAYVTDVLRDAQPHSACVCLHAGEIGMDSGKEALEQAIALLSLCVPGQPLCSEEAAILMRRSVPDSHRLADLGSFRLPGSAESHRVYHLRSTSESGDSPPPIKAQPLRPNNLPVPFTRFFGREDDLERLTAVILEPDTRLVTLTGPGGTGKSRLSLEAGRRLSAESDRVVWFVPLAELSDARLILHAVLDALRIPHHRGTDPLELAREALARQDSVLILDNFEQLVDSGAEIVRDLLMAAPTLVCVVTSRRLLGLGGEIEFAVPPLPIPIATQGTEELSRIASVRLYIDRAQAVRPDFQVTVGNAPAISELCERLEGIPLAIELAAARAQVLTPAQTLKRLPERLDFFANRRRDAIDRHRTLRSAIDWSYRLLTPDLQQFFASLAVFRGSFTVDAAERVIDEADPAVDLLDLLAQLREVSLLRAEETEGQIRFRMMETLREYASGLLGDETRPALQRRHANTYLETAERGAEELMGREQRTWLDCFAADHDNYRAVLEWCRVDSERVPVGLRLAAALTRFWEMRGYFFEGRLWLDELLAVRGDSEVPSLAEARARMSAGRLAWRQGDYAVAETHYHRSLAQFRALEDRLGIAETLNGLGLIAQERNNFEEARSLHEQSLYLWREAGYLSGCARGLNNLAIVVKKQGDLEAARTLYEEALKLSRNLGALSTEANILNNLGLIAQDQQEYDRATQLHGDSLSLYRELGSQRNVASALGSLGSLAQTQGDFEEASRLYSESLEIFRELGDKRGIANALDDMGIASQRQGNIQHGIALYEECLRLLRELGDFRGMSGCLRRLADALCADGQCEKAVTALSAAEALRDSLGVSVPERVQAAHDELMQRLRSALTADAFVHAWEAGRALPDCSSTGSV